MNISERKTILANAVLTYGESAQVDMMIEEMSELTKALLKLRRAGTFSEKWQKIHPNVIEEMADVQIMLDQMRLIYGSTAEKEEFKINRLSQRLDSDTL
jgi:hypothetical protein